MKMKKTVLASAIALSLASTTGGAVTTTVGGTVICDRDEVAAGGIVNIALLGLNANGNVDTQGEQGGSTIIATVKSEQCDIIGGSTSPTGETTVSSPETSKIGEGEFASSTRYVTLDQGNGKVFIQCPPTASGTENVTVSFQEKIPLAGGGFEFENITSEMTKEIPITPPSPDPEGLVIKSFKPLDSDPCGTMDCTPSGADDDPCPNTKPDDGIWGSMTAGMAGGQIEVWATNPQATGNVIVSLKHPEEAQAHTYPIEMILGRATVTLDSQITKAGEYFIEATMDGFEGSSVRLVYSDVLHVCPTGVPAKLKLWAAKERIARADFESFPFADNQIAEGTELWVRMLDAYGNETTNCTPTKNVETGITECLSTPTEMNISLQDANSVASSTALNLFIPANSPDGKAQARVNDNILGNQANELIQVGTTSLVATATDSNGTPIGSIAASDPLEIQVVPTSLGVTVLPEFLNDHLAGEEFEAIEVRVLNDKGQLHVDSNNVPIRPQGLIVIRNLKTKEESLANPGPDNKVRALFRKETDGNGQYLVYDQAGNYGQILIEAGAITAAAAQEAEFQNAHGQPLTDVPPTPITPDKQFYTLLPEVSFKLLDEYGNEVTPVGTPEGTGYVFAESSNGQILYNTIEGTHAVPGRLEFFDDSGIPSLIAVVYEATGPNQFAGQDAISLNFTKPASQNSTLTTTIPAYQGLVSIQSYLCEDTIPANSEVAITVETLDDKGNPFIEPNPAEPTNVTVTINGQEGDNVIPSLTEIRWVEKPLTEIECQVVGGTFTDGRCQLTPEQCKAAGGTWMNNSCMEMVILPVVSGQTLDFSETGGRKVLVVNAGATEGQFSLTFTDSTGTVTETRTIKVGQVVPDCVNDPTTCKNEEACKNTQSIWSESQCYLAEGLPAADTTNPNYPVDEADATFKAGLRNLTQKGESFQPEPGDVTLGDKVSMACNIKVDEEHEGKPADILVAAVHIPVEGKDPFYAQGFQWYMVRHCREVQGEESPCPSIGWLAEPLASDKQGNPYLPALEPLESVPNLPKYYTVRGYVGNLPYQGRYEAYCGYVLTEGQQAGKIIYNGTPIVFNVKERE